LFLFSEVINRRKSNRTVRFDLFQDWILEKVGQIYSTSNEWIFSYSFWFLTDSVIFLVNAMFTFIFFVCYTLFVFIFRMLQILCLLFRIPTKLISAHFCQGILRTCEDFYRFYEFSISATSISCAYSLSLSAPYSDSRSDSSKNIKEIGFRIKIITYRYFALFKSFMEQQKKGN